jgi:hypothetical protein
MAKPKSFARVRRLAAGGDVNLISMHHILMSMGRLFPARLITTWRRVIIDRDALAQESALALTARRSAPAIRKKAVHLRDETVELDRLGIELIAARG